MPKVSPRAQLIVEAGRLLYGEQWRKALADASEAAGTKVSVALINFIANGERVVTPATELKIAATIIHELTRRMKVAKRLTVIRKKLIG